MPKLHISFRIEAEKLKVLEGIAKQKGRTVSSILREIVNSYIEGGVFPFFETVPVVLEIYDRMLEILLNLDKLPLEEAATIIYNYFIWKYGNDLEDLSLNEILEEVRRIFTYFCKIEKYTLRETDCSVIIHIRTASTSQATWISQLMKITMNKLLSHEIKVHNSGRSVLLLILST